MYERILPRLKVSPILAAASLMLALMLAACVGTVVVETQTPAAPTQTTTIPHTSTPTSTVPTATEVAATATTEPEKQPTATAIPSATPRAEATATTAPARPTTAAGPGSEANIWGGILGPAAAPEGWSVRPCEGAGPLLCVFEGDKLLGGTELNMWHWDTLPNFQEMLKAEGIEPAAADYQDPEQAGKILAALRAFVEDYHKIFEEDRRATYEGRMSYTYTRLPTEEARIGAMSGLRYGFTVTDGEGKVLERWLSHSGFDGSFLYTLVFSYHPDSFMSFPSDEQLQRFEPYLPALMEGLRLPMRVVESTVKQALALGDVAAHRMHALPSEPVGYFKAGDTIAVTGESGDRMWWRVECPDGLAGHCWIEYNPQLVQRQQP